MVVPLSGPGSPPPSTPWGGARMCCPTHCATEPRVSRSCEHFLDGFDLHLLPPSTRWSATLSSKVTPFWMCRCGAGAGYSAIKYQSLSMRTADRGPTFRPSPPPTRWLRKAELAPGRCERTPVLTARVQSIAGEGGYTQSGYEGRRPWSHFQPQAPPPPPRPGGSARLSWPPGAEKGGAEKSPP